MAVAIQKWAGSYSVKITDGANDPVYRISQPVYLRNIDANNFLIIWGKNAIKCTIGQITVAIDAANQDVSAQNTSILMRDYLAKNIFII